VGAIGAGSLVAGGVAEAAGPKRDDDHVVNGVLERIDESAAHIAGRRVRFDRATRFNRDGVATWASFRVGDWVVAEIGRRDTVESIEARYGLLIGDVTAVGSELVTTGGSALIASTTLVRGGPEAAEPRPLSALHPSEHVAVTTRFDGQLRDKVARVIRIL